VLGNGRAQPVKLLLDALGLAWRGVETRAYTATRIRHLSCAIGATGRIPSGRSAAQRTSN